MCLNPRSTPAGDFLTKQVPHVLLCLLWICWAHKRAIWLNQHMIGELGVFHGLSSKQ